MDDESIQNGGESGNGSCPDEGSDESSNMCAPKRKPRKPSCAPKRKPRKPSCAPKRNACKPKKKPRKASCGPKKTTCRPMKKPACRPKPKCGKKKKCSKPGPAMPNGYLNFVREYRKTHCGLKPQELLIKAARAWCRLRPEKKMRFRRMACKLTQSPRHKNRSYCKTV